VHGEWGREVGASNKGYIVLESRDVLDLQVRQHISAEVA
jgi:hypothetical protein